MPALRHRRLQGPLQTSSPGGVAVRITRPKRRHDRPICLIEPGIKSIAIHDDFGTTRRSGSVAIYDLLQQYENHVCYVGGVLTSLRQTTGATSWQASAWRGKAVSMSLDGTKVKVHSLRSALDESPEPFN